eukprot:7336054-Alexandrium_andersonii.AAC.1
MSARLKQLRPKRPSPRRGLYNLPWPAPSGTVTLAMVWPRSGVTRWMKSATSSLPCTAPSDNQRTLAIGPGPTAGRALSPPRADIK